MEFLTILIQLFTLNFQGFIESLNLIPIIITWIFFLFFIFLTILIFLKLFGEIGMYVYSAIAIIMANIQILKVVEFPLFSNPIALGTILFSSIFFSTDILTEHYGVKAARKNVYISFLSFLVVTIIMLFTIGFTPLSIEGAGETYSWALKIQDNLIGIFLPFPTFFVASMVAYLFSQFFDVWLYDKISKLTNKRFLWFRNNLSTMSSALIDNTIFSLLAWIIFNPNPLDFSTVLFTFILGTYVLRLIIAILDTPFMYLAVYFVPKIR